MFKISGPVAAALLVASCGSDQTERGDAATSAAGDASRTAAAAIDGAYLEGAWCYRSFEAGGDLSEENITYEFSADGTLKYQNNSSTPVEQPGSWELADGILKVLPTLRYFDMQAAEVSEDQMTFSAMGGTMLWTRGAC